MLLRLTGAKVRLAAQRSRCRGCSAERAGGVGGAALVVILIYYPIGKRRGVLTSLAKV